MALSPGKQFEKDFMDSVPDKYYSLRLKDSSGSWSNTGVSRFTPKNPYDSLIFTENVLFSLEFKSFKGKSKSYSSFAIDKKGKYTKQLSSLAKIECSDIENHRGLYVFNFRDLNKTYAFSAMHVVSFMENIELKSISIAQVEKIGVLIPQTKKRIHYKYDIESFIDNAW